LKVVGLDLKLRNHLAGRRRGVEPLRVVADASVLPFRDGTFEWSFSTLFFHHFDAAANRRILAEMRRVAAAGVAVVDLRRNRLAPALLNLLFFLLRTGEVTRHDGRVSFARSWTLPEVASLVAGEPVLELRRRFPFRFSLVLSSQRRS
jgi:ubiquinone/menaquinone biosynthesis C-methylase UbiE